jgi:hypothetical protein
MPLFTVRHLENMLTKAFTNAMDNFLYRPPLETNPTVNTFQQEKKHFFNSKPLFKKNYSTLKIIRENKPYIQKSFCDK